MIGIATFYAEGVTPPQLRNHGLRRPTAVQTAGPTVRLRPSHSLVNRL